MLKGLRCLGRIWMSWLNFPSRETGKRVVTKVGGNSYVGSWMIKNDFIIVNMLYLLRFDDFLFSANSRFDQTPTAFAKSLFCLPDTLYSDFLASQFVSQDFLNKMIILFDIYTELYTLLKMFTMFSDD